MRAAVDELLDGEVRSDLKQDWLRGRGCCGSIASLDEATLDHLIALFNRLGALDAGSAGL